MRRLPKGFSLRKATVPGRQEKSMGEQKYLMALRQQGCTNRPFYHIVITKVGQTKDPKMALRAAAITRGIAINWQ